MKRKLEAEIESTRKELINNSGPEKAYLQWKHYQISKVLDGLINEYNSLEGIPGQIEWIEN